MALLARGLRPGLATRSVTALVRGAQRRVLQQVGVARETAVLLVDADCRALAGRWREAAVGQVQRVPERACFGFALLDAAAQVAQRALVAARVGLALNLVQAACAPAVSSSFVLVLLHRERRPLDRLQLGAEHLAAAALGCGVAIRAMHAAFVG